MNNKEIIKTLEELHANHEIGIVTIGDKENYPSVQSNTKIENITGWGFNDKTLFINEPLNKETEISFKSIEQITSHQLFCSGKYGLFLIIDSVMAEL